MPKYTGLSHTGGESTHSKRLPHFPQSTFIGEYPRLCILSLLAGQSASAQISATSLLYPTKKPASRRVLYSLRFQKVVGKTAPSHFDVCDLACQCWLVY
ncbi:hypothetical protein A2899_02320 [Candidatus Amesbacteria bacterium RIFCSPLOWO2_01_FULL_49_25]|uniref:Uncharacterized protein n=1 Tax=Candidatus Amesbacteria bacterium RIFCSPHIGHO2_01_FULL_48_32b TaxID=1797253 RepID=A0A1F4YEN2_9BACT|nr:MAG: hypothetical protein A2876_04050 [Candidatus Amesbacteria bacterium RIFCSPHIGHO2_01_FULL_48_32b]OGD08573.1 MAG: hypothetical protein A2899_02320 [Candidatus Amesbacteria bacterium RIFCSPLOWO2_01_FULL_49_25]